MSAAYILALIFALIYGFLAGTSERKARWMLPVLDVLQSVPVLGFFPIAIFFFISIIGKDRLGMEFASVFLIFTSMAWNLAFGVYESLRLLPREYQEVAKVLDLPPYLQFSRIYLPVCTQKLVFNSMMSWAGGWYFLVACEIISLGPVNIVLPGLGTLLSQSVQKGKFFLTFFGILSLILVILAMELCIWRPMIIWAQKFRIETGAVEEIQHSHVLDWYRKNPFSRKVRDSFRQWLSQFIFSLFTLNQRISRHFTLSQWRLLTLSWRILWVGTLLTSITLLFLYIVAILLQPPHQLAMRILPALLLSFLRLFAAFVLSLSWTLPLVLLTEESPRLFRILYVISQIGASIPATAFFPLIVFFSIEWAGGMNLASILLVMTGMQWYILFNLLAGVQNFPRDLQEASRSFLLPRPIYWRKILLPFLTPSLLTGSVTGWGGGWNALIISEYVVYKEKTYSVFGIGWLLDRATYEEAHPGLILYTLMAMVAFILLWNSFVWKRLYAVATEKFRVEYG